MFDAGWHEIIRFVGAAIGAGLLWGLFSSALRRRGTPAPLLVLLAAGATWYSGEALAILVTEGLRGSPISRYAVLLGRLGLAATPSALLCSVLAFAEGNHNRLADRLRPHLFSLALVPGLSIFLIGGLSETPGGRLGFSVYLFLSLILSACLCIRLIDRSDLPIHKTFYRLMAAALSGVALLLAVSYPLGAVTHRADTPWLSLALFLCPLTPAFVLGYFVYRYSFYRIIVNPTLLYSALTGVVLVVYLLTIRRIALAIGTAGTGIRPIVIEVVLLGLLVFLFQPVKNRMQRLLNRLFFRDRFEYQRLLGELSGTLNFPVDLDGRLRTVLDAVSSALKVNTVSLVLLDRDGEGDASPPRIIDSSGLPGLSPDRGFFSGLPQESADIRHLAARLSQQKEPLDAGELHRGEAAAVLDRRSIQICLPVTHESQLMGFLCLGEKKRRVPFSPEERELLSTLSNQIALAVENGELIEQRLAVERRMFEAERLSSLGMLSASIAHEVRNPLSAIKAIATVLKERLSGDSIATEDLTVVLAEIDRLSQVVNRLLRFARPEPDATPTDVSLPDTVTDVVTILGHEAIGRNVVLRSDVVPGLVVHCRPGDLKEALFNLILNGIQAIDPDTGGEVTVSAKPANAPAQVPPEVPRRGNTWVEVLVTDTGPGIGEAVTGRVFEPFYTTKVSGSGLGLAIVRQNLERMGGTIVLATNRPGGAGASFALTLPGAEDEGHNTDR